MAHEMCGSFLLRHGYTMHANLVDNKKILR